MIITEKRALLFKLYLLARCGNDENMYLETLYTGIPDGTSISEARDEISYGEYDDDIDTMLSMYERVIVKYEKNGFFIDNKHKVVYKREELISLLKSDFMIKIPDKIYKRKF